MEELSRECEDKGGHTEGKFSLGPFKRPCRAGLEAWSGEVVVEEGSCVVMWLQLSRPGSKSQCCSVTGVGLSFLFGKIRIMAVPSLVVGVKGGQICDGLMAPCRAHLGFMTWQLLGLIQTCGPKPCGSTVLSANHNPSKASQHIYVMPCGFQRAGSHVNQPQSLATQSRIQGLAAAAASPGRLLGRQALRCSPPST